MNERGQVDWGNAEPGEVLGEAGDYRALIGAIRQRKAALRLTSGEIAGRCGLEEGYVRKLLSGHKRLGDLSMALMLSTLGLKLAIVCAEKPMPGIPKSNLEAA